MNLRVNNVCLNLIICVEKRVLIHGISILIHLTLKRGDLKVERMILRYCPNFGIGSK